MSLYKKGVAEKSLIHHFWRVQSRPRGLQCNCRRHGLLFLPVPSATRRLENIVRGGRGDSVARDATLWISVVAPPSPAKRACKTRRVFSNTFLPLPSLRASSVAALRCQSGRVLSHAQTMESGEKVAPSDATGTLPSGKPLGRKKSSWAPDK